MPSHAEIRLVHMADVKTELDSAYQAGYNAGRNGCGGEARERHFNNHTYDTVRMTVLHTEFTEGYKVGHKEYKDKTPTHTVKYYSGPAGSCVNGVTYAFFNNEDVAERNRDYLLNAGFKVELMPFQPAHRQFMEP